MRSLEENKEFYRQYIEEIFNQRNLEALSQYVAEDYILHDAPEHFSKGPKAIEGVVKMFEGAFSDFHVTLGELICEDDLLASTSTFVGTHSGPIFGIPATGKKIKMTSLTMVRLKDGKVKESWVKNDIESLRKQLQ